MRRARFSAWLLLLALGGCADPLPPPSLVDSLRVLAVRASPPSAPPGSEVALDTLVADPAGDGRALSFAWAGCLDPIGDDPQRCFDEGRARDLGDEPEARLVLPADAPSGSVYGVAVLVCASGSIERSEGARPVCAGGEDEILATKRVTVAEQAGENPTLDHVAIGIETALPDEVLSVDLCGFLSCGPARVSAIASGPDRASLWTAFAATAGTFETPFVDGTRPSAFWDAPEEGGLVRMYFVARDDLGGAGWAVRDVDVQSGRRR